MNSDRISTLIQNLPRTEDDMKVDAALIVSSTNRFYFSGFRSSDGFIFVTREQAYLIVDFRYYEAANRVLGEKSNLKIVLMDNFKTVMSKIIKKHRVKNILIEADGITLSFALKLEKLFLECSAYLIKTHTLDQIIQAIRSVKSNEEIKKIRSAQSISEKALDRLVKIIKPGISEKQLAFKLEFFMKELGAEALSFDTIIASGKNSSMPHAEPSDKRVEPGDCVTIDMGAVFDGYHSDMTRTFFIGPKEKISEKQMEIYNIVLKAQTKAISAIKPGEQCDKIDHIAREIIEQHGYGDFFGHSLGHGVGLCIHEPPNLSVKSKTCLAPGMIVTVEPGVYLPDEFGVRIEDMILVTDTGYENLTNFNKCPTIL